MKMVLDKIQFENRQEISYVLNALDTFLEEHQSAKEKKAVKELSDLLDAMLLSW